MKKLKKLLLLCVLTAMVLSCITPTCMAADEEILTSGDFEYTLNDTGVTITKYVGKSQRGDELVIPAELDGLPVTALVKLSVGTDFVSVVLPESLVQIEGNPFATMINLVSISVPKKNPMYATIDGVLFDKASRTLLRYPSGKPQAEYTVPDGIEHIGDRAFFGATNLNSVVLPDSITSVGNIAFGNMYELSKINIPKSLVDIGLAPFSGCYSLYEIMVSPENEVYACENGIFYNREKHMTIKAEKSIDRNQLIFPDDVETIGSGTFADTEIQTATLPDTVKVIEHSAFRFCRELKELKLPTSVEKIEENAFANCDKLVVLVPDGSYAKQYAIDNGLPYITYEEEDTSWLS